MNNLVSLNTNANTYTIADSDVFGDTPNLQPDWIPPCADELNLLERLTYTSSTVISSLVDSIDVLYNYKSILSFTSKAAFFNSRYNGLDSSTSLHKNQFLFKLTILKHRYSTMTIVEMVVLTLSRRCIYPLMVANYQ